MYNATVPPLLRILENLRAVLKKGHEHATANEIDEKAFVDFRFYPDMLPFRWQVYIVTDTAKFAMVRLGDLEAPKFDDTESTFDELDARIAKTIAFLETVKPEQINGTEQKQIVMKRRGADWGMTGADYISAFVFPQVFFHATTAYVMLRHNGVKLAKVDFLGPPTGYAKQL